MSKDFKTFKNGIKLKDITSNIQCITDPSPCFVSTDSGSIYVYSGKIKTYINGAVREILTTTQSQTVTQKCISASCISNSTLSSNNFNCVRFIETSCGCNYVGFQPPSCISCNLLWTLPDMDGSSCQVLSTNGGGVLSWTNLATGSSVTILNNTGCPLTTDVNQIDFLDGLNATLAASNQVEVILCINTLTDEASPLGTDELAFHDAGIGIRKSDIQTIVNLADHDMLLNWCGNKHIDWTASCAGTIDPTNYVQGGAGSDCTAIHDNTASEISSIASKAVPIAADFLIIEDSAAGNVKKSITIGSLDHNLLTNTHNLTTDINHNTILNNHNLTTDINHNTILNNHNLTTDIDHDMLTNFVANEHIDWTANYICADIHACNISAGSVTQYTPCIDHDMLTNFVANEHIDWTSCSAGTIHASNIPALCYANLTLSNLGTTCITADLNLKGGADVRFYGSTDTTQYIAIQAPATLTGCCVNYTLTLPSDDGASGQVLSTNGCGLLSWICVGGSGTITKTGTPTDNYLVVWDGTGACICVVQPPNANIIVNQNLIPSSASINLGAAGNCKFSAAHVGQINFYTGTSLKGYIFPCGATPCGGCALIRFLGAAGVCLTKAVVFGSAINGTTTHDVFIGSGNQNDVSGSKHSGNIQIRTGNSATSTGYSGNITLITGTSPCTRGTVIVDSPTFRLLENKACPTNYIEFQVPDAIVANSKWILPADAPALCEILKVTAVCSGNPTLSWVADLSGCGGSPVSVYNCSGACALTTGVVKFDFLTGIKATEPTADEIDIELAIDTIACFCTTPVGCMDFVVIYDCSTCTHKKVLLDNLVTKIHDTSYYRGSVQTTNACATTILDIATTCCMAYYVKAKVIGQQNDGTESSVFEILAKFNHDGGTLVKSSESTEFTSEDNVNTNYTLAVSGTNIRSQVTGIAGETYDWIINVEVMEI